MPTPSSRTSLLGASCTGADRGKPGVTTRFLISLVFPLFLVGSPATALAPDASIRPITLRDILSVREITEQQISPGGRTVAFAVKEADLAANGYDCSLYVIPTAGKGSPRLLLRAKSFSNVRWVPRSDAITYLSGGGKLSRVWKVSPSGGEPTALFTHPESITQFEWSPDGNSLAFVSVEPVREAETAAAAEKGVVYNDSLMFPFWDFVSRSWVKKPTRVWLYRVHEKDFQKLWEQEPSIYSFESFSISKLAWAPDGQKIAVVFNTSATASKNAAVVFNSGIGLISLKGGGLVPLPSTFGWQGEPSWSPDSQSIAFLSEVETQGKPRDGFRGALLVHRLGDGRPPLEVTPNVDVPYGTQIWWSKDAQRLVVAMESRDRSALYEVPAGGGQIAQVSRGDDHLSGFSLSADQSTASCIVQGPMKAPEIGVLALPVGTVKTLTAVNAAFDHVGLGEVSRITWKNKFGWETNGFLIKPIGFQGGEPVPVPRDPLRFSRPVHHASRVDRELPGTGVRGERLRGPADEPAQGIRLAIRQLRAVCLRPGLPTLWPASRLPWTRWRRWESPIPSGPASWAGATGASSPTSRSRTTRSLPRRPPRPEGPTTPGSTGSPASPSSTTSKGTMGGSPYSEYDKRFDDLSTVRQAHRVSAPLLIEAAAQEMLHSLEFYTALRRLAKPVELVIYPDEGHIYSQPKHRLASMERNLDWFSYWLLGRTDPDPGKHDQYARWTAMKAKLATGE